MVLLTACLILILWWLILVVDFLYELFLQILVLLTFDCLFCLRVGFSGYLFVGVLLFLYVIYLDWLRVDGFVVFIWVLFTSLFGCYLRALFWVLYLLFWLLLWVCLLECGIDWFLLCIMFYLSLMLWFLGYVFVLCLAFAWVFICVLVFLILVWGYRCAFVVGVCWLMVVWYMQLCWEFSGFNLLLAGADWFVILNVIVGGAFVCFVSLGLLLTLVLFALDFCLLCAFLLMLGVLYIVYLNLFECLYCLLWNCLLFWICCLFVYC